MTWLSWRRLIAIGLALMVAWVVLPAEEVRQTLFLLAGVVGVVGAWVGVRRVDRDDARPLAFIAAGISLLLIGDLCFYYFRIFSGVDRPFPSVADGFFMSIYPFVGYGIVLLIRRCEPGGDRASLIDACIVATATGLLSWVYLIRPSVLPASSPLLERLLGTGYPVLDVLLFALAVRLIFATRGTRPAYYLLAGGIASFVVADALYGLIQLLPDPDLPIDAELFYVLYMAHYTLVGAALLNPTAVPRTVLTARSPSEVDWKRLVLLGAIVLVAPLVLAIQSASGDYRDVPIIVVASVVLFLLVIVRMAGLMKTLQHARAAEAAANEAKSVFLATMSHEIRTPLNAVIGMAEVMLRSDLGPEERACTEVIGTSGRTLLALINDILDFSKIESGAVTLEHEPFDIGDCIESALDVVAPAATGKGLRLVCRVDPALAPTAVGDETRLRQILSNLLVNAVKFTEQGEILLALDPVETPAGASSGEGLPSRRCLHFFVKDTGIGIPSDALDRLFQSFSQVDPSTTRRYGGTGLGLAISKRLCELMGGSMWVESEVGRGSTFHFTVELDMLPAALRPYREGTQPTLTGKRVLIVDDDAGSRPMLTQLTRTWGMLPREAESLAGARSWLRRGDPFDIAIVELRQLEGERESVEAGLLAGGPTKVPVVVVSSPGQHAPGRREAEASGWITRPIKASHLFDVLIGVLAGQPRAVAPRTTSGVAPAVQADQLRILVAENDRVNQRVVLMLLQKLGNRADVVANGFEAIDALRRQPYDVVLMDVQMPEMDGLEATREIHRLWSPESRPHIVALTANATASDRDECVAAGMDDYLSKPVTLDDLARALGSTAPAPVARAGPGPSSEESILDRAVLARLRDALGAAPGALASLVDTFLEEAPALLTSMRRALLQGDAQQVGRSAHTLKSSAATFGARDLSALCRELERLARTGDLTVTPSLVDRANVEFERAATALRAWVDATAAVPGTPPP